MPISLLPERTQVLGRRAHAAADRGRARQVRRRPAQAKRAVAIALRNRMRRQKLPPEMAEEVMPKNILMIGPTGVGKTEIARRLARLAHSPFIKVEASSSPRSATSAVTSSRWSATLWSSASTWCARSGWRKCGAKAAPERRGAAARSAAAAVPHVEPSTPTAAGLREQAAAHAREASRPAARRPARRAHGRDRRAGAVVSVVRDHLRLVGRGDRHQPEGHAARACSAGSTRKRKMKVPEALEHLVAGGGAEAHRHGQVARMAWSAWNRPASSSWTRSTRSPAARAGTGPT